MYCILDGNREIFCVVISVLSVNAFSLNSGSACCRIRKSNILRLAITSQVAVASGGREH